MTIVCKTKTLFCLQLFLLFVSPTQAWRLEYLARQTPSSRLLHKWPRQRTFAPPREPKSQHGQDVDNHNRLPSKGVFHVPQAQGLHHQSFTAQVSLWKERFVECCKNLISIITTSLSSSSLPSSLHHYRRRRPSLRMASTVLLLWWTTFVSSHNFLVDTHHSATATTNTHVVTAAVLPRRTLSTSRKAPAKSTATSSTSTLQKVTVGGVLLGAVAGGSVLGRSLLDKNKSQQVDNQEDNQEDNDKNASINNSITKTTVANDNLPSQGNPENGLSPLKEELDQVAHRQSELLEKAKQTETLKDTANVAQTQAREMVQRILDQYKDEKDPVPPPPPAASNAGLAVGADPMVTDANPLPNSPFLPLSTKSLPVEEEQQQQDETSTANGNGNGNGLSFVDAIQKMTPNKSVNNDKNNNNNNGVDIRRRRILQPRSPQEDAALQAKYAAIPDLSERAYQILLDLGLLDENVVHK